MSLPFRRQAIRLAAAALLACLPPAAAGARPAGDAALEVYKSETCACCVGWIEHMERRGWRAEVFHPEDLDGVKRKLGVPPRWRSCHTAVTRDGWVFEGHIPEKFIARFLAAPPEGALGLAVPGMPIGGPGMEIGRRFTPYDILLINRDGSREVFASVGTAAEQY